MANTYNAYSDIKNIYDLKGQWEQAGDEESKKKIAATAQTYYDNLKKNGHESVANSLSASNYKDAKAILDSYTPKTTISNPQYAVNAILNQKKAWADADKAGDQAAKDKAHENAMVYYNQLINSGYANIANDLTALNADGAKSIMDQYIMQNSGVDNLAYNNSMINATDKNNTLAGHIDSDRKDVQGKYDDIYKYANSDVTKTDEYKSTYNNLMAKYDLSALQGRNNAVASGGASNGGNIDSYAAANAMRQQAALTAQGQVIAHQAGLDAYNARVSNVANILNQLGVYNSGTYDAMNQTITNDRNVAQQYFENEQTSKNNEVARLAEEAKVTGNTPLSWIIKNDAVYSEYLNEDGSFKKEKEGVDIQARINYYKSIGDTETAEKLAAVRAKKIDGNYDIFGKYINEGDLGTIKNVQTEAGRQFDKTDATNRFGIEKEVELGKYGYDTQKAVSDNEVELGKYGYDSQERQTKDTNATSERMNTANNQNTLDQMTMVSGTNDNIQIDKNGKITVKSDSKTDDANTAWSNFTNYFTDEKISNFLNEKLKPYYDNGVAIDQATLEELIVGNDVLNSNSTTYDIDVEEARDIIKNLNILLKSINPDAEPYDDSFLDNYKNRWGINSGKGMK